MSVKVVPVVSRYMFLRLQQVAMDLQILERKKGTEAAAAENVISISHSR